MTEYGVRGCKCQRWLAVGGGWDWTDNPSCPYHGILPRERTDTGMYKIVVPMTDEEPVAHTCDHPDCISPDTDHHKVAVMMTSGYVLECVGRGCPAARRRPNGTLAEPDPADCEACEQYGECLDCEQEREARAARVADAAKRVARISERLNERLACSPSCDDVGCPDTVPGADGDPVAVPDAGAFWRDHEEDMADPEYAAAYTDAEKHLASGALKPALTATEEKYYWLVKKPAWWRRLFRR